ncbi:MAG: DUF58 domain-containing protein [Deltaproteobacteria bacterium]|nr:DUF58 domain-containing protein [Deltaproteobacteria bacterium]
MSDSGRRALLDPVVLAQIATRKLRARHVVHGALAGLHRSPHHGSSVEFAEHKEYSPGDDLRHVDWRALARFDKYYVKRFETETELAAYLVVDTSGSMGYAGGARESKLLYASRLAASLAYLLIQQRDRVGLVASGAGALTAYVPPRARTTHLPALLGVLEGLSPAGATSLDLALDHVLKVARRRSLVVLLSDLLDPAGEATLQRLGRLSAGGHDVVVLHVLDDDELEFPFERLTQFESLEDERKLLVEPRTMRAAYLAELKAFLERTRRALQDHRVDYRLAPTSVSIDRPLVELLDARAHGRRSGTTR